MAAVAAIMLYMEVPRIAFETQRQKEQMLIERGQQYKRAIQLFLRASNNQRWPASLDELDSFNGKRFLRRRYKDPMTGKDQWRLVHIQNGVLTDSVNNKPASKPGDQNSGKDALAAQTIGDYGNSVGNYDASQGGGAVLNAARRRRSSDSGVPGGAPFPGMGGAGSGAATPPDESPTAAQPVPGQTGPPPGLPGLAALPGPGMTPGSGVPMQPFPGQIPGQANTANPSGSQTGGGSSVGDYSSFGSAPAGPPPGMQAPAGSQPGAPAGQYPPGMPGPPANSQNFGGMPGYPMAPGAQGNAGGYPQPGMSMNPGQSGAAASLINNLLTTPRPGGLAGINNNGGVQGTVIGGGIAGVASTVDDDSIMVYNNHSNYREWEFVFDPAKQHYPPPNPVGGVIGTPASQLGSMQGSTPGTPASQMGTMPGTVPGSTPGTAGTPGTPGSSPFGAAPTDPDMRGGRQ
jgi:hypothetical protein